jgi:predicted acetyltransferase
MINRASDKQTAEIRTAIETCFPDLDSRYLDYYFKFLYKPEHCFVKTYEDKIIAMSIRTPHDLMFNGRVLRTSMIAGVCTLPDYRRHGYMKELMDILVDAVEHSELLTLIQTEQPALYEPYGFRTVYNRREYSIERKDVKRITNFGCAYEPPALDLLKVYSAYIKRFNGFYARTLKDFVNYKKEIALEGGKIVAFYNGKDQIQGYAAMIPEGRELRVDELVYLDSLSLMKLCNAALQEKRIVHLRVSEAEDFSRIFPSAPEKIYGSTMVKLNDTELFTRVFSKKIESADELPSISSKPLNLNEFE